MVTVLTIILIMGGILSFFIFVLGVIAWTMSGGDKQQTELARQRITAAVTTLTIIVPIFVVITLLEPLLSSPTALIPSEFVPIILVSLSIAIALFSIWLAIRFLYRRQQERRKALIDEIKKHDSEFFERVKQQLVRLENQVKASNDE